jgi:hypothetical protein
VVREQQFEKLGLKRQTRDRRLTEAQAQQQRAQAPVQSRRADTQQPMFNSNRATHSSSGAGAVGPWMLVLVLPLIWVAVRNRTTRGA